MIDDQQADTDREKQSVSEGDRRGWIWRIVGFLLLVAIPCVVWYWQSAQAMLAEQVAKEKLDKCGALLAMDAGQQHVASISLPPGDDAERFKQAVGLLPALGRLNALDATGSLFVDEYAVIVGKLGSLKSLTMSNSKLSDAGLAELGRLSNLESLSLVNTVVSDEGLPALAGLDELKVLDLSGTAVSTDLTPLGELAKLQWLVLRNLSLADGALPSIAAAPALKRVTLDNTTVSDESRSTLAKARPELKIEGGAPSPAAE